MDQKSSGTTSDLWDVFFTNRDTGTVVGGNIESAYSSYGGTILSTTDGGKSWIKQEIPVQEALYKFPLPVRAWEQLSDLTVLFCAQQRLANLFKEIPDQELIHIPQAMKNYNFSTPCYYNPDIPGSQCPGYYR